jgi:hypothetical protein
LGAPSTLTDHPGTLSDFFLQIFFQMQNFSQIGTAIDTVSKKLIGLRGLTSKIMFGLYQLPLSGFSLCQAILTDN